MDSITYPKAPILGEKIEQEFKFTIPQISPINQIEYGRADVSNFIPKTKFIFELTRTSDYIEFSRCAMKAFFKTGKDE